MKLSPLSNFAPGRALTFDVRGYRSDYGSQIAKLIAQALADNAYTGKCEFFSGDIIFEPGYFVAAIVVHPDLDISIWKKLTGQVKEEAKKHFQLNMIDYEPCRKQELTSYYVSQGTYRLEEGRLVEHSEWSDYGPVEECPFYQKLVD